nr:MAG TPA: Pumilio-family RNA binding repeat [Caudoviricetes sp.]
MLTANNISYTGRFFFHFLRNLTSSVFIAIDKYGNFVNR